MGPRPQPIARPSAITTPRPVEVIRIRSRHAPPVGTDPLPMAVLGALQAIAREMRDVPRDCVVDRAELLHWLRRMANRVDAVSALRVTLAVPKPKRTLVIPASAEAVLSARDRAEAVFAKEPVVTKPQAPRTILNRKGRVVRVEFRRAEAHGQTRLQF